MNDEQRQQARAALQAASDQAGGGVVGDSVVAEALGCSRSMVSVLRRNAPYPSNTDGWLARALAIYVDVVACPFIGQNLPTGECRSRSAAPQPFGGMEKRRWWNACQSCDRRAGGGHGSAI